MNKRLLGLILVLITSAGAGTALTINTSNTANASHPDNGGGGIADQTISGNVNLGNSRVNIGHRNTNQQTPTTIEVLTNKIHIIPVEISQAQAGARQVGYNYGASQPIPAGTTKILMEIAGAGALGGPGNKETNGTQNDGKDTIATIDGITYTAFGGKYGGRSGDGNYQAKSLSAGKASSNRPGHSFQILQGKGAEGGNAGSYVAKYSGSHGPKGANGGLVIVNIDRSDIGGKTLRYTIGRGGSQARPRLGAKGSAGYIKLYLFRKITI